MVWIWQQKNWFDFKYDDRVLVSFENQFLHQSGVLTGATQHMDQEEVQRFILDLACDEVLFSSEIEGEHLNRDSLRSSLRKNLGLSLKVDKRKVSPAEEGMSEMMGSLYHEFDEPLTNELLFAWHEMVMRDRRDLDSIGSYRTHADPMQIVSGNLVHPKVHYEAPPSSVIPREMKRYIKWFNSNDLPILTRAGMAHLYFECLHPFEDGNGRIGRAIAMKAIFQGLRRPAIIGLSDVLNGDKKNYYSALAKNNRSNDITEWLIYFSKSVLKAQEHAQATIDFVIAKKKFYDRFRYRLNVRQEKVIARLFREGVKGFVGGLSAKNYMKITDVSASTATRDLQQLVEMGALFETGHLKGRRYFLKLTCD